MKNVNGSRQVAKMMRALTIWQPWATLIMIGAKPYEFRRWDYRTRNRGVEGQRIVVHAGARPVRIDEIDDIFVRMSEDNSWLCAEIAMPLLTRIKNSYKGQGVVELAAGLGTAVLGTPKLVIDLLQADSDRIDHHVWAWPLTDIRPFPTPIRCRGAQGFWQWPFKEEDHVHETLSHNAE